MIKCVTGVLKKKNVVAVVVMHSAFLVSGVVRNKPKIVGVVIGLFFPTVHIGIRKIKKSNVKRLKVGCAQNVMLILSVDFVTRIGVLFLRAVFESQSS